MADGAPTASVDISVAGAADADQWRAFLDGAADATLFHDWRWGGAIERAFGHRTVNLIARRAGEVVGVLPLIDVRSALFGRAMISTAFTVGGGVVAIDDAVSDALAARACVVARPTGARRVELRGGHRPFTGWIARQDAYQGFSRALPDEAEDVLGCVPRKRRAEIRKALDRVEAGELVVRHNATADEFYTLYAVSLRNLGTPVFARRFIHALAMAFPREITFSLVEQHGKPIFSLCSFRFRDRVMPYYAGVTPAARDARAVDLAYYAMMRRAIETGARWFDFGRSKVGSPHAAYKRSWGFEPVALFYQYALFGATDAPNLSPTNPKFKALTRLWSRLPLWAANTVGPIIARHLA